MSAMRCVGPDTDEMWQDAAPHPTTEKAEGWLGLWECMVAYPREEQPVKDIGAVKSRWK